jgi:cation transport ATPase
MAVWTALGRAADEQVLFRSGAVLERLARIDAVGFDKTGTLTDGAAEVRRVLVANEDDRNAVISTSARLASSSLHGLSQAIGNFVDAAVQTHRDASQAPAVASMQTHAGRGVAGLDDSGTPIAYLGSVRWMVEMQQFTSAELTRALMAIEAAESPIACVSWGGAVRGVFVFREQPAESAGSHRSMPRARTRNVRARAIVVPGRCRCPRTRR